MDNTFEAVGDELYNALPEGVELRYTPVGTNLYSRLDHGGGDPEFLLVSPKKGFLGMSTVDYGNIVIHHDDNDQRKIASLDVYLNNTSRVDELNAILGKFKKRYGLISKIIIRR